MLILGYDPGGSETSANGVAILDIQPSGAASASVNSLDCVDGVVEWFQCRVGQDIPEAVGIDTLLSWSTKRSGLRVIDVRLRARYKPVVRSVLSCNSIYGSMCVQGIAAALRLRECWASIRLNETHPKVAYYACMNGTQKYDFGNSLVSWLERRFNPPLRLNAPIKNEHEWDALFSAWATWQGLLGNWHTDLMTSAQQKEKLLFPAGSVSYYWPEEVP